MVDQLSAKWFEAAFAGICELPNLEWLMRNGTYFNNAFTSNPVCCPTRATIATGLTSRGHGVLENGYQLDPEMPTFMKALQQNGWRTGAFGKVHLQPHYRGLYPDFAPYGFDVVHGTEDSRGGEWLDWVEETYPAYFESVLATVWASDIPEFERYGSRRADLKKRIERIRANFTWATDEYPRNSFLASVLGFPEAASQTNWITGHALDYIQDMPPNEPLYAHISYVQPHSPFHTFPEYFSKVEGEKVPAPVPAEWIEDPDAPMELKRRKPAGADTHDVQYCRKCYFADLMHLDAQLGKILEGLSFAGRLDNTYIIFLSDHGELLFDHGLLSKEEKHYDACVRVPVIISGPGLKKGVESDRIIQLEDICPTVLDITGGQLPSIPSINGYPSGRSEAYPVMPGRSLIPLCRGEGPEHWRQSAYIESYNHINSSHRQQWARTIRTYEYRYTFYPGGDGEQLFDLRSDADETQNLVSDPRYSSIRTDLRDRLIELIVMQDYPKTRRELYQLGTH